jgi:hypothetical protein
MGLHLERSQKSDLFASVPGLTWTSGLVVTIQNIDITNTRPKCEGLRSHGSEKASLAAWRRWQVSVQPKQLRIFKPAEVFMPVFNDICKQF